MTLATSADFLCAVITLQTKAARRLQNSAKATLWKKWPIL